MTTTQPQERGVAQDKVWKDIPGYEELYQASSLGDIRSLDRVTGGRSQKIRGKVLRLSHNLSYGTRSENGMDRHRDGTQPFSRPVVRGDGKVYPSLSSAARENGCTASNLLQLCKGKGKTLVGYTWKFAEVSA